MAIIVSTPQDLENIRNNLNEHYIQANDISLSDHMSHDPYRTWNPIDNFAGIYDGNGYTISGVQLNRAGYVGFFGAAGHGPLIKNVNIRLHSTIGGFYVGSLVGAMQGGRIENCSSAIIGGGSILGQDTVGGFIGLSIGTDFYNCRCHCRVVADLLSLDWVREAILYSPDHGGKTFLVEVPTADTGGFIGYVQDADMEFCYAQGSVRSGSEELDEYNWYALQTGGFAGKITGTTTVSKCYSINSVAGTFSIGGFVGVLEENASIDNSFSQGLRLMHNDYNIWMVDEGLYYKIIRGNAGFVGLNNTDQGSYVHLYSASDVDPVYLDQVKGFVDPWDWGELQTGGFGGHGHPEVTAISNYYDSDITFHEDNYIAEPKQTPPMKTIYNYTGWDFENIWDIEEGITYPWLRWPTEDAIPSKLWVKRSNKWIQIKRH